MAAEDEYGDGWIGGLPGRFSTWAISPEADPTSVVATGTLPDRHYSGSTSRCLEDGQYTFASTAYAAWSSEASWNVCGVSGGLGGSLKFQVWY